MPPLINSSEIAGVLRDLVLAVANRTRDLITIKLHSNTASAESSVRMECGWGVITAIAANQASENVSFNTAFSSPPIVLLTFGGDNTSSTEAYGLGGGFVKAASGAAMSVTASGFQARCTTIDSTNWSTGNRIYYQWLAIGT